jgi:hypothetical protein
VAAKLWVGHGGGSSWAVWLGVWKRLPREIIEVVYKVKCMDDVSGQQLEICFRLPWSGSCVQPFEHGQAHERQMMYIAQRTALILADTFLLSTEYV